MPTSSHFYIHNSQDNSLKIVTCLLYNFMKALRRQNIGFKYIHYVEVKYRALDALYKNAKNFSVK